VFTAWTVGIVLLAILTLLGLNHVGSTSRRFEKVGAFGDSTIRPFVVDSGVDAYRIWKQQRLHGRMVLFLTGEWERVDPDKFFMVPDERSYPLEFFTYATAVEESRLDRTTFLYAATVTGIARNLFVILPEVTFATMSDRARGSHNAHFTGHTLQLSYHGLPRTFATLAHLPHLPEAMLLYVGASFFRDQTPESVYSQLRQSGLITDCIILSTMRDDLRVTEADLSRLNTFAGLIGGGV
jgi:hypothetical protein